MGDDATIDPLQRISAAVAPWTVAGATGTHLPEAADYGEVDVAILRDVRWLLSEVQALRAENELLRELVEDAPTDLHLTDGYVHHNDAANRSYWFQRRNAIMSNDTKGKSHNGVSSPGTRER